MADPQFTLTRLDSQKNLLEQIAQTDFSRFSQADCAVMARKTRDVALFIAAVNDVFTREVGPRISNVAQGLAGLRQRLVS